jgi:16S rRNA (guanine527-N7)-methyltransferase
MEIILKYFADFTEEQLRQFKLLEPLYKEWNEKINVISRKDIESLYEKHVLHSLAIAASFDFAPGSEIVDLGTGGGFPGVPLAIFFPEVKFHLVDSIGKKLKVVEAVAEGAGIKNITTQHSRIEDIKNTRLNDSVGQGKFDFVVSRAVAPLKDLWRWSKPLLKVQGTRYLPTGQAGKESAFAEDVLAEKHEVIKPGLICLKGGDLAAEIHESLTKPGATELSALFSEPFFKEKYLLYISKK